MRLRLIIQDREYCSALLETIGRNDRDIFVEVGMLSGVNNVAEKTLIITDLSPDLFRKNSLHDFEKRVVFLTTDPNDRISVSDNKIHKVFKYREISSILSDIEQINYMWTGDSGNNYGISSRVFAVCSDSEDKSELFSRALARQIVFRKGGRILIVPLQFINEYFTESEKDRNRFSRLMYYIDAGRECPADFFTYNDCYGISYLRLPQGLNPIAYMNECEIEKMIKELCRMKYDTVILDVGKTYSAVNISLVNKSDNIVYFSAARDLFDIKTVLSSDDARDRVHLIPANDKEKDVELYIDDYLRKIYGIEEYDSGNDQKDSSKKVFK